MFTTDSKTGHLIFYSSGILEKTVPLQKIGCSTHLKNCPACAKLLEELNADDQLLRDLRGSVELYQQLARKTNTRPAPKTT